MKTWGRLFVFCLICCGVCLNSSAIIFAQNDNACDTDTDFLKTGQALLKAADYENAIADFTCAIEADKLNIGAYRGRIEALLLAGIYSEALRNYTEIAIHVIPETPNAVEQIIDAYRTTLDSDPENIILLTGYSFALWWVSDYEAALIEIEKILAVEPDNFYALMFHGSTSFFLEDFETGERDFARVLELVPENADIHFVLADAYTYAVGDMEKALEHGLLASELGLDTARLNAILGTAYFYLGDEATAIPYFARHIERATVETIEQADLEKEQAITLNMIPGQTYRFLVEVAADETLKISTTSDTDAVDTIMVLLAADGTLVTGNDDSVELNAGFEKVIEEVGIYTLLLSSFEGAGTGEVNIIRQ